MKKRILAFLCLITLFVSSITVNAEEIEVGSNESVMASSSETYAYSIGGVNSAGDDFTPECRLFKYNIWINGKCKSRL